MNRDATPQRRPAAEPGAVQKPAYESPRLTKYGSLAALTRSGTGSKMEGGGPPNKFG